MPCHAWVPTTPELHVDGRSGAASFLTHPEIRHTITVPALHHWRLHLPRAHQHLFVLWCTFLTSGIKAAGISLTTGTSITGGATQRGAGIWAVIPLLRLGALVFGAVCLPACRRRLPRGAGHQPGLLARTLVDLLCTPEHCSAEVAAAAAAAGAPACDMPSQTAAWAGVGSRAECAPDNRQHTPHTSSCTCTICL